MSAFVYRLQVLLDQKIERKREAQQALVERQRELAAEQEALEQCIRNRSAAAAKLEQCRRELFGSGQAVAGSAITMRRDYIRRVEAELTAATDAVLLQENRVQDARDRVKDAQRALTEASLQVEVMERHKQRLSTRFQREMDRKEALEQDETGNIVYLRRRQQA